MSAWQDLSILIPAVSGLVGALIGGLCSIWAARSQVRAQSTEQKREVREYLAQQMLGLKIQLKAAKTPMQCTEVAMRLRRFFLENPERLNAEPTHREFFDEHLAPLSELRPPSDLYWTDHRLISFWAGADEAGLKP